VEIIKLVSNKGRKNKNKKAKRRRSFKAVLIVILVLALAAAGGAIALGVHVNNRDTIFPNVSVDGIDLSGLELSGAYLTLVSMGYEDIAEGVYVTIYFPDGSSFTISGDDAGFSLNAQVAANAAFAHGRDGSIIENLFAFVRSMFNDTELNGVSVAELDEEFVWNEVASATRRFNETLLENAYTIYSDSIVVVKGASFAAAEEDSVFALTVSTLREAFEARTHLTEYYLPSLPELDDIDLAALYSIISAEPLSSVYDPETFSATESAIGVSFDLAAAQTLLDNAEVGSHVVIPLIFTEPEVSMEYLQAMLFRDVLHATTTNIDGSADRLNNIVLASNEVHETIVNPGEIFSFNETVGRRTTARGFRYAGGFAGGRLVPMVGGGICQVSSGIFNSVLHAYLEVVERRAHGLPIGYLPLGQDATVSWGAIDLRFRNNTDFPILIESVIDGRRHTLTLIGTKLDDTSVRIESNTVRVIPFETVQRVDSSVPPGQTVVYERGANGFVVDTYRRLYDRDGNLISRTRLARDTYRAQTRIVLIPVPGEDIPEEPPTAYTPTEPAYPTQPTDPTEPTDPTQPTDPTEPPTAPPPTEPPDEPPPQIPDGEE